MKKTLLIFTFICCAILGLNLFAEGSGSYEGSGDSKAKAKKSDLWVDVTDKKTYDEVFAQAKKENKFIYALLTGSDWCPPCIKFENKVLSQQAFKAYAPQKFVLALLDMPRKRKISDEEREYKSSLMRKHELQGVPSILIFTPEGELIHKKSGFPGGLKKHLTFLKNLVKKQVEKELEGSSSTN